MVAQDQLGFYTRSTPQGHRGSSESCVGREEERERTLTGLEPREVCLAFRAGEFRGFPG